MSYQLDVKRLYLPFKYDYVCENCGHTRTIDFEKDPYLNYPVINAKTSITIYCPECNTESEGLEVEISVDLKISKKS